jgi:hypothetical protein
MNNMAEYPIAFYKDEITQRDFIAFKLVERKIGSIEFQAV